MPAANHVKRPGKLVLAGCAVLALTTACGTAAASNGASAATPAATAGASRTAYVSCLRAHGAALPTATPTAKTSGNKGSNSIPTAAREACASLRPVGGDHKNAAVQAFDSCMSAHGEKIPAKQPNASASAKPTGVDRFLHGLNPSNAQVAAALKSCESKLTTPTING